MPSSPYFYPGAKRIAAACKLAGFTDSELVTMIAIHGQETSGNVWVRGGPNSNGTYDFGAFQINSDDPDGPQNWKDYFENAKMAKEIYDRQGFNAWYAYKMNRIYNKGGFMKHPNWTWVDWAHDGVSQMNAELAKGYSLVRIASA
ncbi:MAG: hypothetical protein LC723_06070, partial [Actinobacteria bacterium]|nr:hypothetical protein [Actinomycetota bacterium]